jgi:hypothetical protein
MSIMAIPKRPVKPFQKGHTYPITFTSVAELLERMPESLPDFSTILPVRWMVKARDDLEFVLFSTDEYR